MKTTIIITVTVQTPQDREARDVDSCCDGDMNHPNWCGYPDYSCNRLEEGS